MTEITPELLLKAYAYGVFPMAKSRHETEVYWVQPKERGIIPLDQFHIPRSLKKSLRKSELDIRVDSDFAGVIAGCAESQPGREDTWINEEIVALFSDLFDAGLVHTVEAWRDETLVGGLYGLSMGGAFFGESMFSRQTNASKIALCHLAGIMKKGGYRLLDTQFMTKHLRQFGAIEIAHKDYLAELSDALGYAGRFGPPLTYSELENVLSSQSNTQTS